jgi:pyruvate kinase
VRRTKIVATIGPASQSPERITELLEAGVDVFRLSLAHGSVEEGIARIRLVRSLAPNAAIMVDIPGPKIRAGSFGTEGVALIVGREVTLEAGFDQSSTAERIVVEREGVVDNLHVGDEVHIGDGGVSLRVTATSPAVTALVVAGGTVMGKPGLSLPSSLMNDRLPTDEDRARLEAIRDEDFDILAVSFVRSDYDAVSVRSVLSRPDIMIMAKIETQEGVDNLDSIVEVCDSIMVARGDLGVRLPIENVPHLQKSIVRQAISFARPVVVATQMLESMTHAHVPTRAEVTDVANAVLDGASAVMLSAETAIGADPAGVVRTMDRILRRAEEGFDYHAWGAGLDVQRSVGERTRAVRVTAAITGAAWRAAMEEQAVAIVACTQSGMTARAISRFRPPMPIVAITSSASTARQLGSSWGVNDVIMSSESDMSTLADIGVQRLVDLGIATSGDAVVIMAGSRHGGAQMTDTVRMVIVD